MLRISLLALLLASSACASGQVDADYADPLGKADGEDRVDPPALHGMLLVGGGDQLFASHLPMFHRPHDFQVILEVTLDPAAKAALEARRADVQYFTLAPKPFVLRRVVDEAEFTFAADLYADHFERGGERLVRGASVTVKSIVTFQRIHADGTRPEANSYIVFGNADRKFAAHVINAQPDFDQVIEVTADMAQLPAVVSVPGLAPTDPITADSTGAPFTMGTQIYLEHGDLE